MTSIRGRFSSKLCQHARQTFLIIFGWQNVNSLVGASLQVEHFVFFFTGALQWFVVQNARSINSAYCMFTWTQKTCDLYRLEKLYKNRVPFSRISSALSKIILYFFLVKSVYKIPGNIPRFPIVYSKSGPCLNSQEILHLLEKHIFTCSLVPKNIPFCLEHCPF